MISLILMLIIGLGITFFAMQNTAGVTLSLGSVAFRDMPLYLVAIGGLFIGLVIAAMINLVDSLSSYWTLRGKNNAIRASGQTIGELEDRVHELEIENARLRGETTEHYEENQEPVVVEQDAVEHHPRYSLWDRLRHSF